MRASNEIIDTLLRRAGDGDVGALTLLGKRFLVGAGVAPSPDRGIELLRKAAVRGGAEAAAQLSVCAAWGIAQTRNVCVALDHLQRAAELGWTPAQQELELLAGRGGAAQAGASPAVLRRAIDHHAWTATPAARVVSQRPRIAVIEGFATPAECAWLIRRGRPGLQRALVYRESAQARAADSRTNTEAAFTIFNADVTLSLMRERISAATGTAVSHFEVAKLLHYLPGEQFSLHADFLEPKTPELVREVELRGQRAATFLIYLNEDFEGGETDFPRLGLRCKGRCGDALLFDNIDSAGAPDYATLHAGLPPTRGEKWLFSQWIRTRPVTA